MANKRTDTTINLNKTVIMLTNMLPEVRAMFQAGIRQAQAYADLVNKWICSNLTNKIGEVLLPYIDNKNCVYYELCYKYKEAPLYTIFMKGKFDLNSRNNALYCAVVAQNIDNYSGNIFGFSQSDYRRNGYCKVVFSNYATKMSSLKPSIKKVTINEESTEETIQSQVIYEMFTNGRQWGKPEYFAEHLKYLEMKDNVSDKLMFRMKTLCEYYQTHTDLIDTMAMNAGVEALKQFEGLKLNRDKFSMTITTNSTSPYTLTRVAGTCAYNLHIPCRKRSYDIRLWGNRQTVRWVNGELVDIADIINQHGQTIIFTIKNGNVYVHIPYGLNFEKTEHEIKNVVGVDVNTKHMLMQTSIKDNGWVKGYVNIYKALVEDEEFVKYISKSDLKLYKDLSKYVSFCPLELNLLYTRYLSKKGLPFNEADNNAEKCVEKVLNNLVKQYEGDDVHVVNYIHNVKKLRALCKASFVLYKKYAELQKAFDDAQGYNDQSTETKETMDKRRWENPFIQTREAQELIAKMDNAVAGIIGCRDNIITYAYKVFGDNNYDTVGLENLTTSQFDNYSTVKSPKSLLSYYGLLGQQVDSDKYNAVMTESNKDWYDFKTDGDGNITDITLTAAGEAQKAKSLFNNKVLKNIHFADVKDKFIQLGNNGSIQTVLVPPSYTSQMDSKTHTIYVKETVDPKNKNKKKLKLVDKKLVRHGQEYHKNGLNADINAALNIAYIVENQEMREVMCLHPSKKDGVYDQPFLKATTKYPATVAGILLKMGKTTNWGEK